MHPRVQGMVAGKSDFVYELGCFSENGELYLQTGLQAIVLVTRSQGGVAIDGVSKLVQRRGWTECRIQKRWGATFLWQIPRPACLA